MGVYCTYIVSNCLLCPCSVGGSLPVAFSYFCEFFSKRTRGPFVIVLAGFWILGSVFASLLALAIIEPLKNSLLDITAGTLFIVYV